MPACRYKKIFLKDPAALPKHDWSRIERLGNLKDMVILLG
jgi:hypothetical protein